MVYCEHFETKLDTYASPPPTSTVVIEEMPSSTPVAKPTKTKRLLLEYTPTVNVEDQVVANENANETDDGIMQSLLDEVNVDMADYHFNIDADVEWIRHSESVQEPEYDVNPDDLDVIDNDNFESGTDSDDDGIEKVRRKKLKQIKKAKESEDNIVHKHFFFVGQTFASADDVKERVRLHSIETRRQLYLAKNDKVRIRAKCFGRNPVFILDGEGPSTTDVGPKKKTIKGKGKQDDTPLGPNKKGISSGGRGRPKPLAPDECPWAVQITKVKNSVKQGKGNCKGLYELGVSRQKAFRAKAAALNQVKGDYRQQYTIISDENTRMFKGIYICLVIKERFQGMWADVFVGLDGAFMKGPYQSTVDCNCLDANNGIYPLAFELWSRRQQILWTWFLSVVGMTWNDQEIPIFNFFSDRQKGLAIDMANDPISQVGLNQTSCGNLGYNSRSCKGQKDPYTGTSQTTPSTAPAKKPSDAGTRKRPSDAPAPSTAPAKMNQATKKQCAMSN
ncbi:mutator type transposase [Tanacetum coccineum]